MQQTGRYGRRLLAVGTGLEVKVFDDGVDELWFREQNRPIVLFLHLDAQKVAYVALIIYRESSGAST